MDDIRSRYLRDRVLTATPVQRVVLLYDRLVLDLGRARAAGTDRVEAGSHLGHATQIVAELLGSLDQTAGGPATNLADLYHYLLRELLAAQVSGDPASLASAESVVERLRDAWTTIADSAGSAPDHTPLEPAPERSLIGSTWTA